MFVFLLPMEHRGEIIEQAIRKSGISISKIAKKLNRSRQWVYVMFENPNVSFETILEIEKIIHYDFSNDIKNLNRLISGSSKNDGNQQVGRDYWKDKYFKLLEEHLEILKKIK